MTRYHLKRLPAPKNWDIARKAEKYITRPHPGPHSFKHAMSLNTVLISLGHATTKKEVKYILKHEDVMIDGKKKHEEKHLVGFMDVLSLPKAKKNYRGLINSKGLHFQQVTDDEAKTKLVKITEKSNIKKGKMQIHTHDGRNILVDKDAYKVGDTLELELPSQKVKNHFKLEKGASILLYKGAHIGTVGHVEEVEGRKITFVSGKEKFETRRAYAFVVGKDKPVIKID